MLYYLLIPTTQLKEKFEMGKKLSQFQRNKATVRHRPRQEHKLVQSIQVTGRPIPPSRLQINK